MKIHFGAFNCPVDGWTNTDITQHLYIARVPMLPWLLHKVGALPADRYHDYRRGAFRKLRYLNVSKRWPFGESTADAIFSSHVLEHLSLSGAAVCLSNAYRVLKPGGVLRIVVPDLDRYVAQFEKDAAYEWAVEFFEAHQSAEKNMHHFMYNGHSMARLMRDAGFTDVRRMEYRVGACPDLDQLDNRPESLFMEAIR